MIIANKPDMLAAFGADEVEALTLWGQGDTPSEAAKEQVLENALQRAGSEAASYLAARYPLFKKPALPEDLVVPPVLINAVCDIARYRLTGGEASETSPIVKRYEQAIAWLRDIAAGRATLTLPEDEEAAADSGMIFSSGTRIWADTAQDEDE